MTEPITLWTGDDLPQAEEIERGAGRPKAYFCKGERVPSATTIAGRFKDSGGLIHWAFQRGKAGHDELYDEAALGIGSLVHQTIEAEINGMPVPAIPEQFKAPVLSAINAWHEWFLGNSLTILATEVPLVSESYMFGGTLDTIVRDRRGNICIGDWKSSKAVYQDYLVQMAGYKILWEENRGPITGGFHLVRFSKEHGDMEHRFYPELADAEQLFVLYREAYDLDKNLKKRAR